MKRIFLIGYMGAGKTSLGKPLAQSLGLSFIDLDHYIEQRYHAKVSQLFEKYGEEGFRRIEHNMLLEVSAFEDVVIATGGGAPCFLDNMAVMNEAGVSVYLRTAIDTLWARLKVARHSRPLLKNKSDEELLRFIEENLALRQPYYEAATLLFNADKMDSYAELKTAQETLAEQLTQYYSSKP